MNAISVHGGLVLYVRSVTSEGINVLVANSPNLLTFIVTVNDGIYGRNDNIPVDLNQFKARLEKEFSHRQLCVFDNWEIAQVSYLDYVISYKQYIDKVHHNNTSLFSLWQ